MPQLIQYAAGVYAVDADYLRPKLASIHLIVERGRAAIVDTGCNASLPNVVAALAELNIAHEAVDYVILTHIHLDHAGGAGGMMRAFPNAKLVVHPRGARHMADPSKLVAGASAVYGEAEVQRMYGEVLPIDVARIIESQHEMKIDFSGRELLCIDTPGHAKHHLSVVDKKSGGIFTGDIFGLSYRELDTEGRQFIFPTTTPVQFDPDAMHASLDLLLSYAPRVMYLTHYSEVNNVANKARELHRLLDAFVEIALSEKLVEANRHARIRQRLEALLLAETKHFGCRLPEQDIVDIFDTDLDLNAQGLDVWLNSQPT